MGDTGNVTGEGWARLCPYTYSSHHGSKACLLASWSRSLRFSGGAHLVRKTARSVCSSVAAFVHETFTVLAGGNGGMVSRATHGADLRCWGSACLNLRKTPNIAGKACCIGPKPASETSKNLLGQILEFMFCAFGRPEQLLYDVGHNEGNIY